MAPPYRTSLARRLAATAKRETVRTTTRTPAQSAACDWQERSGSVQAVDGVREARGTYALTLAPDATLALRPDEEVTLDGAPGRIFKVVFTPPPTQDDSSRAYGLDEVR